ncbi:hypothetical protein LAG90_19710 [Marinilongibacter aquaticus]|uniref:hypothetical protein n=1 Tax=Marinilongibacter aquaticus TaxID=2975157 RepID=UPI0021BD9F6E|nr:hypothetical protein [Marinilongibacter aquaticus]UBM59029.1 hypothetical protein LAG90_19710 [Marinilongibacter aquaticus]
MKLFLLLSLFSFTAFGQHIVPTQKVKITGLVKSESEISWEEIATKTPVSLGNFRVSNHLGEFRKEYQGVRAVPLLPFLEKIEIQCPSPKILSQYYFVFKASDGYAVVASWNELFNTAVGQSFYFVTEADGKSMKNSEEGILLISAQDIATGRRHVKALQQIEVRRID